MPASGIAAGAENVGDDRRLARHDDLTVDRFGAPVKERKVAGGQG